MKPALVSFNAVAAVWCVPASMLAYIRHDAPSGSVLLILAGVTFGYAYQALAGGAPRSHS